eukprot:CAMPEP_0117538482 /NCGR_PEP_ID=MMETSP0784-20121206/42501_1 /TAXON_ID=39447 /ORGANISM="" /LENGTH=228 /DNA_ID=CAMNT_0005335097 /DNA_START=194 /DNA_END=876 /DNA_ORIENTATION=+
MASYDACESLEAGRRNSAQPNEAVSNQQAAPKLGVGPIFLENPDGTILEATPSTFDKKKARGYGPNGDTESDTTSQSENVAATMYEEVDFLFSRHECVFWLLLFVLLVLETLYSIVFVLHMKQAVEEFSLMYGYRGRKKAVESVYWCIFAFHLTYSITFYAVACMALYTKHPKYYQKFATWALAGIVAMVFLAYFDEFNLLIFFLRLLAYIYARFLQGLSSSLLLLPP